MHTIPADKDLPEIYLFESKEELEKYMESKNISGAFSAADNRVYATKESLAHELAHFKDHKSGKMPRPNATNSKEETTKALVRNEIVAVAYSWQKLGTPEILLKHEKEFLELYYFLHERRSLNNLKPIEELSFAEIQSLAEELSDNSHPYFEKTKYLFEHYIDASHRQITY